MGSLHEDGLLDADLESLREMAAKSACLTGKCMLAASELVRELTQGEYSVLVYLEASDKPLTAVEIADHVSLTRPRITQIVSSLERRGYVTRAKDERDKRKVNITISDAGREIVQKQREGQIEGHMRFLAWLGDDKEALIRILEKSLVYFQSKNEDVRR